MFLNSRTKPKELKFYEALNRRCRLSQEEERKLAVLRKGYEGEREYDSVFDEAGHENLLIYRDVWMKIEDATLQIDALIITENSLIVNEIKNYSGFYSFDNDGWMIRDVQISADPLAQASRTGNKLLKLRYLLQQNFSRQFKVIFVNPDFNLEAAPGYDRNIIKRSTLRHYMKNLNKMYAGPQAYEMSEQIKEFFIDDPMILPEIDINRIRLGNYCFNCGSFSLEMRKFYAVCRACGSKETLEKMFVRGLMDYSFIFWNEPMTSSKIGTFLMDSLKPRTIRRMMNTYCHKSGDSRSTSYKIKNTELEKLLLDNNYTSKYETDIRFKKVKL